MDGRPYVTESSLGGIYIPYQVPPPRMSIAEDITHAWYAPPPTSKTVKELIDLPKTIGTHRPVTLPPPSVESPAVTHTHNTTRTNSNTPLLGRTSHHHHDLHRRQSMAPHQCRAVTQCLSTTARHAMTRDTTSHQLTYTHQRLQTHLPQVIPSVIKLRLDLLQHPQTRPDGPDVPLSLTCQLGTLTII